MLEPQERKMYALVQQLNTIRNDKVRERDGSDRSGRRGWDVSSSALSSDCMCETDEEAQGGEREETRSVREEEGCTGGREQVEAEGGEEVPIPRGGQAESLGRVE